MVSFLSLFSKKKPKRSSPPTSPRPEQQTPFRPKPAQRFLSLRHKTKGRPYDLAARRMNSEVQRKMSNRQNSRVGEAPRLDLAFEVRAGQSEGSRLSELGYEEKEKVVEREIEVVRGTKFALEDVKQGWKWFGKALRERGIEAPGLMLPDTKLDTASRDRLLILFALALKPNLSSSFPTFTHHSPTPGFDAGNIWTDRLHQTIMETSNPVIHAEVLRFILRRLDASTSSTTVSAPILEVELYTKLVQAERAARYPKDAYILLFLPSLRAGVGEYLEEVFEVWASIAAKSKLNHMSAGKLCLLLGWWVWGAGTSPISSWKELYNGWTATGRKVEHLFLAWIRYQSTLQTLPTKLLQLVEVYPFGKANSDDQHSPLPPPSTFARQVIHVTLSTTAPVQGSAKLDPSEILQAALKASVDQEPLLPIWKEVRASSGANPETLLESKSQGIIRRLSRTTATAVPANDLLLTPAKDDGPLYRPFSAVLPNQGAADIGSRRRSRSYGDAVDVGFFKTAPMSNVERSPAREPEHSLGLENPSSQPESPAAWADFEKIGFADSPEPVNLGLSPSTSSIPLSPLTPNNVSFTTVPRSRDTPKQAATVFSLQREEIIEVDDTFMAFTEDGQLDPSSTANWPPFTLLRLAEPLTHTISPKPIEWLLITVEYRSAPIPTSPFIRPASPGTASTTSRAGSTFGMSSFTNSFRRSSSYGTVRPAGGLRTSLFGGSAKSLSRAGGGLESLSEMSSRAPQVSPTSLASVGEMGELLKPEAGFASPLIDKDDGMDTKPEEWVYKAEGGAHIIFGYAGSLPGYKGNVLRIRKPTLAQSHGGEEEDLRENWREKQLPRLLPPRLLLDSNEMRLPGEWATSLMKSAHESRPASRKDKDGTEAVDYGGDKTVQAFIMADLLTSAMVDGEKILCVEIKPKWGFLPSEAYLHPPESIPIKTRNCRFCLHQHLRNPDGPDKFDFCPLDLYSGDELRMSKAVEGLWGLWRDSGGTGNNWRIYVDGQLRSPEGDDQSGLSNQILMQYAGSWVVPALRQSNVLNLIRRLQYSLDSTDISDLAKAFAYDNPGSDPFDPARIPQLDSLQVDELVSSYLEGDNTEDWDLKRRLLAYTLSAIFKDCSIFVQLPAYLDPTGSWVVRENRARVKVIDLDLKPITSLRHWYDLDTKIWTHWRDTHPVSHTTLSRLVVPDGDSTRAVFTPSGRVTPTSMLAESLAPSSIVPQNMGDPPAASELGRSLGSKRSRKESDGISLGGALAISPTRSEFDASRRPSVGTVAEHLDLVVQSGSVPVTIRVGSESPVVQRKARSLAPSPSPLPDSDAPPRGHAGSGDATHLATHLDDAAAANSPSDAHYTSSCSQHTQLHQSSTSEAPQTTPTPHAQLNDTDRPIDGLGGIRSEASPPLLVDRTSPLAVDSIYQSASLSAARRKTDSASVLLGGFRDAQVEEMHATGIRDNASASSPPHTPSRPITPSQHDPNGTPRSAQRASGQTFGSEGADSEGDTGFPSVQTGAEADPEIPASDSLTTSDDPFSLGPVVAVTHSTPPRKQLNALEYRADGDHTAESTNVDRSGPGSRTDGPVDMVTPSTDNSSLTLTLPIPSEVADPHAAPHPSFSEHSPATSFGDQQNEYPFETARSESTGVEHDPFFKPTGIDGSAQPGSAPQDGARGEASIGSMRSLANDYDALIDSARSTSTGANAPTKSQD